jgi:uroporphyrinogen decarboxylase
MTNRERILRTLRGEPTDRVPLPLWLGFAPWGDALPRWRRESGLADLDLQRYFGFDAFFQTVPVEYGPLPAFPEAVLAQDAEFVVSTTSRGITVRNRRDGGSMPEFIAHPIRTRADWERYKAERLQPRLDERLARVDAFAQGLAQLDAPVQFGTFPWGVFGTARDLLGAEGLLYAFYDAPELVRDIMDTHTDLWLALLQRTAARVRVDLVHIWEDMSGRQGSLISPAMVEAFMMPCYDRIAASARALGIEFISVDTDGDCSELVAVMTRHGVNVFYPFEVQAGNDIRQYRMQYPDLAIWGGLDKRCLAGSLADVDREVAKAAEMVRQGRYIPGFDHLIPPDATWANYRYAVERLKDVCWKGR